MNMLTRKRPGSKLLDIIYEIIQQPKENIWKLAWSDDIDKSACTLLLMRRLHI